MAVQSEAQLVKEVRSLRAQVAELTPLESDLNKARSAQSALEQRLRTLFDCAPEAIVLLDVETGRFIDANPKAEKFFGLSRRELAELGLFDMSPPFQPDGRPSRDIGLEKMNDALRGGVPIFEWWHCNAQGQPIPCEVRLVRIPWGNRDVIYSSLVDTSDKKLLELTELCRRRILESIARGACLSETLESLVRTIEHLRPGMICSILLLDPDTKCLRNAAAPSLPDFYNAAVDGLTIGPTAGSCGPAVFTNQRVVVSDLMNHPSWSGIRRLAERAQLRACWSEPVSSLSGSMLGTFAVYYREPGEPAAVDLKAIEVAAQLTAIAIEYERIQRSQRELNATLQHRVAEETKHLSEANRRLRLGEQDARLAAVAFDTHDSIMITDKNGKILRVNPSFTNLTGYAPEDVIGKTPRILKSGRHGKEFYGRMWRDIRTKGYWEGEIWNKRKDGHVYLQRLTIACVKNEAAQTTHYVADGQDLTSEKRAEVEHAAIQAARIVQQALFPSDAPCLPGFDIAGAVRTAEHASGDFFDYISLGQNSLGVLVADVCGHGLGPALLAAQTQAYLRALAESHTDPGELLTQANRLFAKTDSERFVTMFLCRLDQETRSLVYAGAGHRGYLFHANGEVKVLKSPGLPLGVVDQFTMPSAPPLVLEVGDIILLPTDGIEEAFSPAHGLFGRDRMFEVVRNNREKSAAEIVETLLAAACRFGDGEPQMDDITAVVVKTVSR
jgi:PAS domain S-box-containing protein